MKNLIVILTLAAFSCSMNVSAQKNQKASKSKASDQVIAPAPPAVQGPEISFENTVHDYGQITKGANGDCEFVFTNIGNEPLILANVQASCGCTTPNWPREPIMPGQKASVKVHYDTNRIGSIAKSVTVTTNGKTDRIVLRITGNISE